MRVASRIERVVLVSMIRRNGRFTYADYVTWDGDERWELIDGAAVMMTPAPSPEHQEIAVRLSGELYAQLRRRNCQVYVAPTDLTFDAAEETPTVVQPDLFVMCGTYDREKRITGVPVLVIEILSPSTARRDKIAKLALYERVGVPEYWIVDGANRVIDVFLRAGTAYGRPKSHGEGDVVTATSMEGVTMDVNAVFSAP